MARLLPVMPRMPENCTVEEREKWREECKSRLIHSSPHSFDENGEIKPFWECFVGSIKSLF